ncbi:MAG TPA: sigma-70 family RNA polymerase sigma factor [Myxococcales bacterium]|nr:sigma-70 family RNA polymerase sigma factor [Myxococcales bacterium]
MTAEPKRARFQSATLPHLDRLVAVASRWWDGSEAEDYVQETYARAWTAFHQLRDVDAAFPWLYRILLTVANERRRTQARRRNLLFITELESAHEEIVASDSPSPLELLISRLEVGSLRQALRSIPEDLAEAVELHDVHGLKYREIAQATSVPIGTVMSRISRGRQLLAGLLQLREENQPQRKMAMGAGRLRRE